MTNETGQPDAVAAARSEGSEWMASERKRTSQQFYAAHEYRVSHVIGWDCLPDHATSWWVPELGYTLTEGYQLFGTYDEARLKVMEDITAKRAELLRHERELHPINPARLGW